MVRPQYHLNGHTIEGPAIPLFVEDTHGYVKADLRGYKLLPERWTVQWNWFVPTTATTPQSSRLIDTKMARPLMIVPGLPGGSSALSTLKKGVELGLPSGQSVARAIGIAPMDDAQNEPLWYYVLREAEEQGGRNLGPVGSRIVAEVLIGLMLADKDSYLVAAPGWTPTLPNSDGVQSGDFDLADLLKFAGMPMDFDDLPA